MNDQRLALWMAVLAALACWSCAMAAPVTGQQQKEVLVNQTLVVQPPTAGDQPVVKRDEGKEKEDYEAEYSVVEDTDDNQENLSFLEQDGAGDLEADQRADKPSSIRKVSSIKSRDSASVKRQPDTSDNLSSASLTSKEVTGGGGSNEPTAEYVIDAPNDENGEEDYYQLSNKDTITKPDTKPPAVEPPAVAKAVVPPAEVRQPATTSTSTTTTPASTTTTTVRTTTTTSRPTTTSTTPTSSSTTTTTTVSTTTPTAASVLDKVAADAQTPHLEDEEYDEDPLVDRQVSASSSSTSTTTRLPSVVNQQPGKVPLQDSSVRLNKQTGAGNLKPPEQEVVFNPIELNVPNSRDPVRPQAPAAPSPSQPSRIKNADSEFEDENLDEMTAEEEEEYEDDVYNGDGAEEDDADLEGEDIDYEEDDALGPDLKNTEDYEDEEGSSMLPASSPVHHNGHNKTQATPPVDGLGKPATTVEDDAELSTLDDDEYKDDDKLTVRTTTIVSETAAPTSTPKTVVATTSSKTPSQAGSSEDGGGDDDEELDETDETDIDEELDLTEMDEKGLPDEVEESEELATSTTATTTTVTLTRKPEGAGDIVTTKYVIVGSDQDVAKTAVKIEPASTSLPPLEVDDDVATDDTASTPIGNDVNPSVSESDDYHINYKGDNDLEINYFKLTKNSKGGAGGVNNNNNSNTRNRTSLLDPSTLKELLKSPALLAGIFGGILVGIVTAFVLLFFIIYRMRRRRFDENTYIINGTLKNGASGGKKSPGSSSSNGGLHHPYSNGHYRSNNNANNQHVTLLSSSSISPVIAPNSAGAGSSSSSTSSTTGSTSVTTALLNSGSSSGSGTTNSRLLKYGNIAAGNNNSSLKKSDMALSINNRDEGSYNFSNYAYTKAPTKEFYA